MPKQKTSRLRVQAPQSHPVRPFGPQSRGKVEEMLQFLLIRNIAHAHLLIRMLETITVITTLTLQLPDPCPQRLNSLISSITFAAQRRFGLRDHHVDKLQLIDFRAERIVVVEELVVGGWGFEVAVAVAVAIIAIDAGGGGGLVQWREGSLEMGLV